MSHERTEYSFVGPDVFHQKPCPDCPGVLTDGRVFEIEGPGRKLGPFVVSAAQRCIVKP